MDVVRALWASELVSLQAVVETENILRARGRLLRRRRYALVGSTPQTRYYCGSHSDLCSGVVAVVLRAVVGYLLRYHVKITLPCRGLMVIATPCTAGKFRSAGVPVVLTVAVSAAH